MANIYQKSAFVLCVLFQYVRCQEKVGSSCILKQTDETGQLTLLANCSRALMLLQCCQIYPQTHGFKGIQPIVCCVENEPYVSKLILPTTPKTAPTKQATQPTKKIIATTKSTAIEVGAKSQQKCKEYGQYVYDYNFVSGPSSVVAEECAIVDVQLIVGGEKAKPKEFPHMSLIGFDVPSTENKWKCGGSLISEQFVLTAAHCLYYGDLPAQYVRLGELALNSDKDDAQPQDFYVIEWFRHPDFKPPSRYHDIALLKLDRLAELNTYVRPACLDVNQIQTTQTATATGWGKVGFTSSTSNDLLKVTLDYFSHKECYASHKASIGFALRNGIIDDIQVCVGSRNESKDTCLGDSGGPLQIVNKEVFCTYQIVGVTSFGKACGVVGLPGVYTRVSRYIGWIEQIVWS